MRLRRFEVAEESMLPHLHPGDYLLAIAPSRVRPGDVVVFPHPARERFWLVKRVAAVAETPPPHVLVASDNPAVTMADSRSFGPVPSEGMYRVLLRYWPPSRITFRIRRQG